MRKVILAALMLASVYAKAKGFETFGFSRGG
jgi:hypothetical protein